MADRTDSGWRALLAALAAAALLVVACGAPADSSSITSEVRRATTTTTSTTGDVRATSSTTTTGVTPTTTAATPQRADRDTVALARAAVLKRADFATGFTLERRGSDRRPDQESCARRDSGPEGSLDAGAVRDGPLMRMDAGPASIRSTAYVFATEAQAVDWIRTVRSDRWARCTARRLDDALAGGRPTAGIELGSRHIEGVGRSGFEAYAEFHGRDDRGRTTLVVTVQHYRLDRVVLEHTVERGTALDDTEWSSVDAAHSTALANVWSRLNAARPDR